MKKQCSIYFQTYHSFHRMVFELFVLLFVFICKFTKFKILNGRKSRNIHCNPTVCRLVPDICWNNFLLWNYCNEVLWNNLIKLKPGYAQQLSGVLMTSIACFFIDFTILKDLSPHRSLDRTTNDFIFEIFKGQSYTVPVETHIFPTTWLQYFSLVCLKAKNLSSLVPPK